MIPLRDLNPTSRRAYITWLLIIINAAVFIYQTTLPAADSYIFVQQFGALPGRLFGVKLTGFRFFLPPWASLFTSFFLHATWVHLGGNMLFLFIFGDNVEDAMGHFWYLIFYIAGGFAAAMAHSLTEPNAMVPMIGASGAISAVLGAYFVLFPTSRILTLIFLFYFVRLIELPAFIILGYWIAIQVIQGLYSLSGPQQGIAFFAHIGGFVFGLVIAFVFLGKKRSWGKKRMREPWDVPPPDEWR